jgi:hypothetical protein
MITKENKKAIILPETLKLIIAILCILLLAYLAWGMYSIFTTKSDLAQAKETLNAIAAKANGLGEGETTDYLIVAPKDWYIVAFSKGESMPRGCNGENCICICERYLNLPASEAVYIKSFYTGNLAVEGFLGSYRREPYGIKACENMGTCKNINQKPEIMDTWFTTQPAGLTWSSLVSDQIQDTKIRRDNIGISRIAMTLFISRQETLRLATYSNPQDIPQVKSSVEIIKPEEPSIERFLTEDDKKLLYNLLENKSIFRYAIDGEVDEQELAIKDQISFYCNFFVADNEAKKAISENIKIYFSDYKYPIKILLTDEEGHVFLEVNSGKSKSLEENEKLSNWPSFTTTYPGLKKIYVKFELIDDKIIGGEAV